MTAIHDNDRAVASMISRATIEAAQHPTEAARAVMQRLKSELTALSLSDAQRIEVERRFQETRIALFFDREDAARDIDEAWRTLVEVGFVNPERRAAMLVFVTKNFLLRKQLPDARRSLLLLRESVRELDRSALLEAGSSYRRVADKLDATVERIGRETQDLGHP